MPVENKISLLLSDVNDSIARFCKHNFHGAQDQYLCVGILAEHEVQGALHGHRGLPLVPTALELIKVSELSYPLIKVQVS